MRKVTVLFVIGLLMAGSVYAGVIKKSKTEVSFKDFGKFTSEQSEKLTTEKKLTDSQNKFKGKGIMGKLSGKFLLKSGESSEMIVLPEMVIYEIDHKKKEFWAKPIEKISSEEDAMEKGNEGETEEDVDEESGIKIIRSEFKVDETGESKTINEFPSKKYIVNWETEWEDTNTGEKGLERLISEVWTTPITGDIQKAQNEELAFSKSYMNSLGIDADFLQQAILGTNWIAMLGSMAEGGRQHSHKGSSFEEEMKKIEGYPVVIDGQYFSQRSGGETEENEADDSGGGVKGMLGGLAKKALKKKPKDSREPTFTYYTEIIEFSPANVGDEAFRMPANYKKKGD
jgi:hypothetical protein